MLKSVNFTLHSSRKISCICINNSNYLITFDSLGFFIQLFSQWLESSLFKYCWSSLAFSCSLFCSSVILNYSKFNFVSLIYCLFFWCFKCVRNVTLIAYNLMKIYQNFMKFLYQGCQIEPISAFLADLNFFSQLFAESRF